MVLSTPSGQTTLTVVPPEWADSVTAATTRRPCSPASNPRQRAEVTDAGDLVEERAGLVGEQVGDAVPDTAGVHRQAAADVGMFGPDEHPAGPGDVAADIGGGDLEFAGAVQIPCRRTLGSEQFEAETVGQVVGDPRRGERADRTVVERRGERGDVLVLHRLRRSSLTAALVWP